MAKLAMTAPVESLMSKKVVTVDSSGTAFDAARKIMNHDIGCVVVLKKKTVVGVVTKGDILREVVMKKLDPQKISVENVMSRPVVIASPRMSLADASDLMSKKNLTKLPVVMKDELVGIISATDIVRRNQLKKLAKKDMI